MKTAVDWLIEQLTPSISLQQKHIDDLKKKAKEMEAEQFKNAIPYQLCPKCNGDGNLLRYNSPAMMSTTIAPTCDVCDGNKIILMNK